MLAWEMIDMVLNNGKTPREPGGKLNNTLKYDPVLDHGGRSVVAGGRSCVACVRGAMVLRLGATAAADIMVSKRCQTSQTFNSKPDKAFIAGL